MQKQYNRLVAKQTTEALWQTGGCFHIEVKFTSIFFIKYNRYGHMYNTSVQNDYNTQRAMYHDS